MAENPLPELPPSPAPGLPELRKDLSELRHEDFEHTAQEIFSVIGELKQGGDQEKEAYTDAIQRFIEDETDPRMRQFAELILDAPMMVRVQRRLGAVSEGLQKVRLLEQHFQTGKEQAPAGLFDQLRAKRDELRHRRDINVEASVEYGHQLREFVEANRGHVSREELTEWLGTAGRNTAWARQTVAGVGAEIAVYRQLEKLEGVRSVRFSNVNEDKHGADLVVTLHNGVTEKIDVKTGRNHVDAAGHKGNLKVFVRQDQMAGFSIAPEHRTGFDAELAEDLRLA